MKGTHLTADLYGCQCAPFLLTEPSALEELCLRACELGGVHVVGKLIYRFPNGGITAAFVLAESHLAIHTWPEVTAATLDVYVCNVTGDHSNGAAIILATVIDALMPLNSFKNSIVRGAVFEPLVLGNTSMSGSTV